MFYAHIYFIKYPFSVAVGILRGVSLCIVNWHWWKSTALKCKRQYRPRG